MSELDCECKSSICVRGYKKGKILREILRGRAPIKRDLFIGRGLWIFTICCGVYGLCRVQKVGSIKTIMASHVFRLLYGIQCILLHRL